MDRIHAVIHGRVQGVNFRSTTQREAQRLKLGGWVRNNPDGTVEVVAEGSRDLLEAFEGFLHNGPLAADVESVDLSWHEGTGKFDYFSIKY